MLINSYAKTNLYLDVLKIRPDGYHEIDTLFTTIGLHDCLKFVLTRKPQINFLTNIQGLSSPENLVYKVTQRIFKDYGVKHGVDIRLDKAIPVSAGLGGGSSNAAMTILALNRLLDLKMNEADALRLATEYGSDISFFFYGGFARGTSRGEAITPLPDIEQLNLLLVNPGIAIASSEAYKLIDWDCTNQSKRDMWFNKLQAGVIRNYPVIGNLINEMYGIGASEAMLSGSGATCVGLFENDALLKKARSYFKRKNVWCEIVQTMDRGSYQKCIPSLS